ncbi:hypothetical protein TWF481_000664 [Arthrobotrys musiformis]|uniref:Uncharacterized protein n=1 Tax=Arthrobotrys musiformis TaxID=47236 RepID=A0AAV9WN86_9PEZI
MSNSPVDSRLAIPSLSSQTNPSISPDARPTGQEPVNTVPTIHVQQPDTDLEVNRVETIPSAPPPAYIPPPECRTSRIYDYGDLDLTNQHDNDLERAMPPPPYTAPSRDQAVVIYSHPSNDSGDATATVYYPTMDSYMKASKRRRLYGAVTLAAFIIVGIILLGSLIARQNMGSTTDTADRS